MTRIRGWLARRKISATTKAIGPKSDSLPYAQVFCPGERFDFPASFKISDYSGLLSSHIVRNTTDSVIAYWKNEEYFKSYGGEFERALTLPAAQVSGTAVKMQLPRENWWKRYSVSTFILSVAALFGAFSAMRDYFAVLFATPAAVVSFADNARLNSIEGTPLAIPVTALSEVRFAPIKITFDSAVLQPKSGATAVPLSIETAIIPSLAAGQSQSTRITGLTPKHSNRLIPDVYEITMTATVNAGVIRPSRVISTTKRELWVYPTAPATPAPELSRLLAGRTCELKGVFYIPKAYPQGLLAEIVAINDPGEVSQINVNAPGVPETNLFPMIDNTVRKFEFKTPALDKFEEYPYTVFVEATHPVSEEDCRTWAGNLRISLQ